MFPPPAGWKAQTEQINQLQRYQTRGSFAYIGTTTQKTYARFFWQQYSLTTIKPSLLTNPVGSTELELIVKTDRLQLTDNKGQKYYSDDPDSMIYQADRYDHPWMENLRQWIVGLPGDAQSYAISNQYHLKALSWPYRHGKGKSQISLSSHDEKSPRNCRTAWISNTRVITASSRKWIHGHQLTSPTWLSPAKLNLVLIYQAAARTAITHRKPCFSFWIMVTVSITPRTDGEIRLLTPLDGKI